MFVQRSRCTRAAWPRSRSGEPSRSCGKGALSSLSRLPSCCSAKNQAELACRVRPVTVANTTRLPARLHHQLWRCCKAWANPSWQGVHLPVVDEGRRQRGARRGCARQGTAAPRLQALPGGDRRRTHGCYNGRLKEDFATPVSTGWPLHTCGLEKRGVARRCTRAKAFLTVVVGEYPSVSLM